MSSIEELPTPALLLDLDVLDANLSHMAARARALGVKLRPHAKTHKCIEVAERQVAAGAAGLTVATLYEAEAFADHGFTDITWACPLPISRIDQALELATRIQLGLLVDSHEALDALAARAPHDGAQKVWLKVDCGYHRAGVDPESDQAVDLAVAVEATGNLEFAGILTHSGHAYHATNHAEMAAIAEQERSVMAAFADRLRDAGVEVPDVSVGSTPAMSAVESLDGITEARPGNYALYDHMQVVLGSCAAADCAVSVLASVISRQPEHSVVDAGALAMSKDTGSEHGPAGMGPVYQDDTNELDPDMLLTSLSQEHGILNRSLPVGTRIRVMPNHSCLTVACFDEFQVVQGGEVVDTWTIHRGR